MERIISTLTELFLPVGIATGIVLLFSLVGALVGRYVWKSFMDVWERFDDKKCERTVLENDDLIIDKKITIEGSDFGLDIHEYDGVIHWMRGASDIKGMVSNVLKTNPEKKILFEYKNLKSSQVTELIEACKDEPGVYLYDADGIVRKLRKKREAKIKYVITNFYHLVYGDSPT